MQKVQVLLHHGDGHPAAVCRLPVRGEGGGEHLERLEDLELRLAVVASALEQRRQRSHVVRAEHHVDPRSLVEDDRLVLLGEAAADGDLHALVLALGAREVAECSVELVVRVLAHRAGVDDHHVGRGALGADVPGRLERTAQALGIVHVHLAPEGAHLVRPRARGTVRCGRRLKQCHGALKPTSVWTTRRRQGITSQRKRTVDPAFGDTGRACSTAARTALPE